jgi:glycosyltransferase involved in cell wall biosynthesis
MHVLDEPAACGFCEKEIVLGSISLVVVAPVFEDGDIAATFCRDVRDAFGPEVVVVLVDGGSVENAVYSSEVAEAGLKGVLIRLQRNLGHQRAIAVGISYVADKVPTAHVVVMDSDGEDIPATAPMLLKSLKDNRVDVAVRNGNSVTSQSYSRRSIRSTKSSYHAEWAQDNFRQLHGASGSTPDSSDTLSSV